MTVARFSLSLAQQWLLIAVVTMVPLLTMISFATWSFYQQMQMQSDIVAASDRAASAQSSINDDLRDLERYARQYRLLNESSFAQSFNETIEDLDNRTRPLADLLAQPVATVTSQEQTEHLSAAVDFLSDLVRRVEEVDLTALESDAYSRLIADISSARPQLGQLVDTYTQGMSDAGEEELQGILWQLFIMGAITLPLTLMLMGLGFLQMIRPIKGLSASIIKLGHGQWQRPISVSGPKDLQALGERLEWMRNQLLEAEEQKSAFQRHVSHELKTPLSAIVEAGSLLEDEVPGKLNERQRQVLTILLASSQNLKELIQQILNYNVISDSISLRHSNIDVQELAGSIADRLDQQSIRHGVRWRIGGSPRRIFADRKLLEMMVSNLMSNAHYYSPPDSLVDVCWGVTFSGDGHRWFWLSVADQGPGIDASDLERIFEPFAQGSVKRQGSVKGSGVGLAIVNESVNKLGGRIEVESTLGKGSCFLLTFPLDQAQRDPEQ